MNKIKTKKRNTEKTTNNISNKERSYTTKPIKSIIQNEIKNIKKQIKNISQKRLHVIYVVVKLVEDV